MFINTSIKYLKNLQKKFFISSLIIFLISFTILLTSYFFIGIKTDSIPNIAFFTFQSNIIVCVYFFLDFAAFNIKKFNRINKCLRHPLLKGAVVFWITITGILFFVLLYPPEIYQIVHKKKTTSFAIQFYLITLHFLMPVLTILDFLFFKFKKPIKRWTNALIWFVYPVIYFIVAVIVGAYTDKYPYPFLDHNAIHGYAVVFVLFILLIIVFSPLVYLYVRHINKSVKK